jgi:hypothetical protein
MDTPDEAQETPGRGKLSVDWAFTEVEYVTPSGDAFQIMPRPGDPETLMVTVIGRALSQRVSVIPEAGNKIHLSATPPVTHPRRRKPQDASDG